MTEDAEQQRIDDEENRFIQLISRGEDPYNEDGSIKSRPEGGPMTDGG